MMSGASASFDSRKLVDERATLKGALPVAGFSRLADSLADTSGTLNYRVEGAPDRRQRPQLKLQVRGIVQLQCQRCLEGMAHDVAIDNALRLVEPAELDREYEEHGSDPDEPDCIAHSATLDLAALIEDEVILALPSYPRHAEGRCRAETAATKDDASREKVMAFSALSALKPKV
jgi:uncharacterized protein